MSRTLVVRGPASLSGAVEPPPDKSVAHRALILAALAEGSSVIRPFRPGRDVRATADALAALGIQLEEASAGALRVHGVGAPRDWPIGPEGRDPVTLDCCNSGTTLRLLAGLLTARPGRVRFDGDASLRRRPMERLRPLEAMGAQLFGPAPLRPPFELQGTAQPRGARVRLDVASAQVKSALLLAGLFATGATEVVEPGASRDHTERWLRWLGVPVSVEPDSAGAASEAAALRGGGGEGGPDAGAGVRVGLTPLDGPWPGADFTVPPDFSSAAFLLAAAVVTGSPGVEVLTGVNPTRTGFLDVLAAMGLEVERRSGPASSADASSEAAGPEPVARLAVPRPTQLRAASIAGAVSLRAIDELPLVMGLAAFADGETEIRDAAELRVKESDRLQAMQGVLTAFGVHCALRPDGAVIRGSSPRAAVVDAAGDHRIAMTAAVMGLAATGTTRIRGAEVVDVSYPDFVETLQMLGADAEWVSGEG